MVRCAGMCKWCNKRAWTPDKEILAGDIALCSQSEWITVYTTKSGKDKPVKKLISTKLIVRSRCEGAMQENRVQDPEDQ